MGLVLFGFLVFPKVFTKPKKPSRKPKIPKKTKENQTNIRKNKQNKVFKGFRLTLGYGFVFFVFLVFPKVFTKPTNPSRKPKIQKKTKENQTNIRKHKKNNKLLKVSASPLDMGFVFFLCFFGFPEGFYNKNKNSFEKTTNTKENQRKPKNIRKKQNKVFKGFRLTLGYGLFFFVFLVVPKVFTKPTSFEQNQKYKRKPEKTKKH